MIKLMSRGTQVHCFTNSTFQVTQSLMGSVCVEMYTHYFYLVISA